MEKKYNYLIVDDEYSIIKILTDMLSLHTDTNRIYSAKNGWEALDVLQNNKIDILFTDILMPNLSGIELIKKARELYNDTDLQIIVISAFSDIDLIRESMHYGAYDYILKPFSIDDIMNGVNRLLERIHLIQQKNNYLTLLEEKVKSATEERNNAFLNSFTAMVMAIDARDKYTHKHSENVAKYAVQIGTLLSLSSEQVKNLEIAGILHDLGKIGIPDNILFKPERLTKEEFGIIKTHPHLGKRIVDPTMKDFPEIIDFIYCHHEKFNGKGYPRGLKKSEIPLFGRIANVADSFDAILSKRTYKKAMTIDEAIEEIKNNLGTQFDPEIGKIFINSL